MRWIHLRLGNYLHKWPVTRKMFPFDDVIMNSGHWHLTTFNWRRSVASHCSYTGWFSAPGASLMEPNPSCDHCLTLYSVTFSQLFALLFLPFLQWCHQFWTPFIRRYDVCVSILGVNKREICRFQLCTATSHSETADRVESRYNDHRW